MSKKYNEIAFAIEILRLLAEKPRNRDELSTSMQLYAEDRDKRFEDITQKVTRTIAKLRDCGFAIESSTHAPYRLIESNFPLIISTEQKQALQKAAELLAEMGFTTPAAHLLRLGKSSLVDRDIVKVDFSPPVNYSETKISKIVALLEERIKAECRYTIRYHKNQNQRNWDLDRCELRFHNGTLYLFAFVPDFSERYCPADKNVLFRVDRIEQVNPASQTRWFCHEFPTLTVHYRMSGPLADYQPRRDRETILCRDLNSQYVDIETKEDCLFWFRQRILGYGANVRILEPLWLVESISNQLKQSYSNYSDAKIEPCNDGMV